MWKVRGERAPKRATRPSTAAIPCAATAAPTAVAPGPAFGYAAGTARARPVLRSPRASSVSRGRAKEDARATSSARPAAPRRPLSFHLYVRRLVPHYRLVQCRKADGWRRSCGHIAFASDAAGVPIRWERDDEASHLFHER